MPKVMTTNSPRSRCAKPRWPRCDYWLPLRARDRDEIDDDAAGLPPRRAVLVADVDAAKPRPDLDDAVVRVSAPVALADVAAAFVDIAEAEPAVRAAMEVVDAADLGDEDAELVVGDAQDHDMAWYATQELPFLLEFL